MKKLLLLITALFILASVEGQILRYSNYTAPNIAADPYGPEKLTNGTFTSTSSPWGINESSFTITTGTPGYITYNDAVDNKSFFQTGVNMISQLEVSTKYRLTFTLTVASGGTAYLDIATATGGFVIEDVTAHTSGKIVITFTTPGSLTDNGFAIWGHTASTNTWTITNLSLKEVL